MASHQRSRGDRLVQLIGVFKLVKVVFLVAGAFGMFYAVNPDVRHWLQNVAADGDRWRIVRWVAKIGNLDPYKLRELGVGSLIYAGVFLTEGVNLLRGKRWAEWLTVGVTISFIPLEAYELVEGRSLSKLIVLVANIAIGAYLFARRWRDHKRPKHTNAPSPVIA